MKKSSILELGGEQRAGFAEKGEDGSSCSQHTRVLHRPLLLAEVAGARSWEGCKLGQRSKGKVGNLGKFFWETEIAGSLLWYQFWSKVSISILKLPTPAVMCWHITEKHTVQDKGFWLPHVCIKYCTMWGFIVWLQWQKSSMSHFGTLSKRDLVFCFLHTEMIKKQELSQHFSN